MRKVGTGQRLSKVGLHAFCRNISVGVFVCVCACVCVCVSYGFLTYKTRTYELWNIHFDRDFPAQHRNVGASVCVYEDCPESKDSSRVGR